MPKSTQLASSREKICPGLSGPRGSASLEEHRWRYLQRPPGQMGPRLLSPSLSWSLRTRGLVSRSSNPVPFTDKNTESWREVTWLDADMGLNPGSESSFLASRAATCQARAQPWVPEAWGCVRTEAGCPAAWPC